MEPSRLILAIGLALLFGKPNFASAQIPGAVFSTVCITENQIIKKFGSKRNYDVWRSLHDRTLDLSPKKKLEIITVAKSMEGVTPYAVHQLSRYEARLYESAADNNKAAEVYDWLANSPAATGAERKTAPAYAEKLRSAADVNLSQHPDIKRLNFHFTQSARQKNKSGICIVSFDVDISGKTKNIELEYCSSKYFKKSARKTIGGSSFQADPARKNVSKSQIRLDFYLMDTCGNLLPH